MDKKKRKKIIAAGSIILAIALLIGFPFAWNAGMGLPKGYKRNANIIVASGDILLYKQFEDINIQPIRDLKDKINFNYNGDSFYLQNTNDFVTPLTEPSYSSNLENCSISIHKVTGDVQNEKIGTFIEKTKKEIEGKHNVRVLYTNIFFDDHYIYYSFRKIIVRFSFELNYYNDSRAYTNIKYYRFNLDSRTSEEIKINQFLEKIKIYSEDAKII